MRSMSACTEASAGTRRPSARMFMGRAARSAEKPLCISALAERARARAPGSAGHRAPPAKISLAYSAMASESHTTRPRWCSTGTRPVGECSPMRRWNSGVSRGRRSRVNSAPALRRASQPRRDQEE